MAIPDLGPDRPVFPMHFRSLLCLYNQASVRRAARQGSCEWITEGRQAWIVSSRSQPLSPLLLIRTYCIDRGVEVYGMNMQMHFPRTISGQRDAARKLSPVHQKIAVLAGPPHSSSVPYNGWNVLDWLLTPAA